MARFCQRNEHFKRVGLHYIAFSEQRGSKSETCADCDIKNRCIRRFRDEFRLVKVPPLRGGDFQGMGVYRPMLVAGYECTGGEDQLPR